jgi:hypothetical protein
VSELDTLSARTNSVPLPISELNASSERIREDRGTPSLRYDPVRLWNGDPVERSYSAAWVGRCGLHIPTAASARGAGRLDVATIWCPPSIQTTLRRMATSPSLRPMGEDMPADRTIGIQDHELAAVKPYFGTSNHKPADTRRVAEEPA